MKRALFVTLVTLVGVAGCKKSSPTPEPTQTTATTQPAGSAGSAAAAADPWTQAPTKKDPLKRPLFWSIEKDGITSYALGTIHMGVDAEARLPQIVWDKLDAAKSFAMEADLSDPGLAARLECVKCSLRADLGEKHWKKLEEVLGKNVAAGLDPMKPMVAAMMMSIRGLPQTTQMDGLLLGRAQRQDKPIVYLEAASHQVAMLEKWMNLKALKVMLEDVEGTAKQTQEMLDAYLAGDEQRMANLGEAEKAKALQHGYTEKEFEASMEDMLYARNASWIAPIEKLHAAGGGFIAVGAMHYVGPKSVLALLAERGYEITRITP